MREEETSWLFMSYAMGLHFYKEAIGNKTHPEDYYKLEDAKIVNEFLELAGLRLAYLLNKLFAPPELAEKFVRTIVPIPNTIEYTAEPPYSHLEIDAKNAAKYIGHVITSLPAKVYGINVLNNTVILYLGAAYPDQFLNVVLSGDVTSFANGIEGKNIIVKGKLINKNGKPEIEVRNATGITVVN